MVMFNPGQHRQGPAFERQLQRLLSLASDMQQIGQGVPVTDLAADAPTLEDWRVAHRPVYCLEGLSSGHPKLTGVNRPIVTSDLWLMSSDGQWARTLSRWYRLGGQHGTSGLKAWGDQG
ncbi:MAG TPA: DUF6634 family protein [Tianweitania sediminis]|jgi:hypothetical protein|nr:DUF6634 family protein [Tianweitania sediminis]